MAKTEQKLIIVESPTKAKTIGKFLGKKYKIQASFGHVRDLPRGSLGIDVENDFQPKYVIPTRVRKKVNELKKAIQKSAEVILATDEDREGESIAWHIAQIAPESHPPFKRIVFHEITKSAIENALTSPREIDLNLVDAQQARRILDRLVGYKLSPFLWKKVANRLSAGRVQSVALRLVVDREKERRSFKPQKYWTIEADFGDFSAFLSAVGGKPVPKPGILSEKETKQILSDLESAKFILTSVVKKETKRYPLPPFITSTLQQEASKRLRFSAKQTMRVAQNLYERGFITYMRTDSFNLSQESLTSAGRWVAENLGSDYSLPQPNLYRNKSKLAQEAHEAIRPTDPALDLEKIKSQKLEGAELKLYELIWRRFIASQLPPAVFEKTAFEIAARGQNNYSLRANGLILKFDGFLKIWPQQIKDNILPDLKKNAELKPEEIKAIEHQTEPPPRYNEASLIKALEENGIGRPSTYAPIISVLQSRNYVIKDENRRFEPTEIGEKVSEILTEHFPSIVDINFTAKVEDELDKIAAGRKKWQAVIKEFYEPFAENLETKYQEVKKEKTKENVITDISCELCGKPMAIKTSRFGRFLGCTGFPECRNTKPLPGANNVSDSEGNDMICPKCNEGKVVRKRTKRGRYFYGCDRYPDCDFASWQKPDVNSSSGSADKKSSAQ